MGFSEGWNTPPSLSPSCCHVHSLSRRRDPLQTPHRNTHPTLEKFLAQFPVQPPSDKGVPFLPSSSIGSPGAAHPHPVFKAWVQLQGEEGQSPGAHSPSWDKLNKTTSYVLFFIPLSPSSKNICGLHNLRYFAPKIGSFNQGIIL